MSELAELAARLRRARSAVALTGAGVSTDSGIPDFRSPTSGLWETHDPMRVASLAGFQREPRAFYAFWGERFAKLGEARPNVTHHALVALERAGWLSAVITQNIDGLHTEAGSTRVVEVHGNYRQARCIECGRARPLEEVLAQVAAGRLPICECGGLVKPDVTLFGEDLPPAFAEAEALAQAADVLLVLGSSLEVHPVAGLVPRAHERGAFIAFVNRQPSAYDAIADVVVHADLAPTMQTLADALELSLG